MKVCQCSGHEQECEADFLSSVSCYLDARLTSMATVTVPHLTLTAAAQKLYNSIFFLAVLTLHLELECVSEMC